MIWIVLATVWLVALTALGLWALAKKKEMEVKVSTPPFAGIPLAPNGHWLLGHMMEIGRDGFQMGQKRLLVDPADANGLSSFWFLSSPALSILLGKDVKTILNASSFRTSMALMKMHNDQFLGRFALTALMGKDWKYYRNVVHRSFTPAALKGSQQAINRISQTLVQSLLKAVQNSSEKGYYQREVLPIMKMATIDIFGLAALGVDFGCCANLKSSPIATAFDFMTDEYTRRLARPYDPFSQLYWIPTETNRRHARERTLIRTFIADLVASKRREMDDPTKTKPADDKVDLLTSLLIANAEKGGEMSDVVLADTLMVLLFGGYDTTSITLSYALYLLATNEQVQAECLKEVQSVLGGGGGGQEGVLQDPESQLPYTRAVILETLRLYPAAPVTTRNLEKPLELHGTVFPTGTMCYVPLWSIQRDPRNFPHPEDLRPDRWVELQPTNGTWVERPAGDASKSEESSIAPANWDAFCAFSGGGRNCVGKNLAMREAVTLLAFLIQGLEFKCLPDYQVKPTLSSFVQKPGDDMPMIIQARN